MTKIHFSAYHIANSETCIPHLVDFNNRVVEVLPERNLENGDCETWSIDEIELSAVITDGDVLDMIRVDL